MMSIDIKQLGGSILAACTLKTEYEKIIKLIQKHMDWNDLLSIPEGEERDVDSKTLEILRPVVELTETVKPFRMTILRFDSDSDIMLTAVYDQEQKAYQVRARYRSCDGNKTIPPPSEWKQLTEQEAIQAFDEACKRAMQLATSKGLRFTVNHVAFKANATDDEIIETFASSGLFHVVKIDPEEGRAKKIA